MSKISEKLNIIDNAKDDIKTAIENKGVSIGDIGLQEYAGKIGEIPNEDINEYFITEGFSNTSNSSTLMVQCTKKIPPVLNTSNLTTFTYAFNKFIGTTIPQIDTSQGTNFSYMFQDCKSIESIPQIDTSKGTNFASMFQSCNKLISIPQIDTSSGTKFNNLFYYCNNLTDIPLLDLGKCANSTNLVYRCSKLTNIEGFKDLGKAYTQKSNNYSYYTLNLTDTDSTTITHDSLMNVINNLYDLNLSYDVANGGTLYTQKLVLGSTNVAKLTADEIAIATNKGWVVS